MSRMKLLQVGVALTVAFVLVVLWIRGYRVLFFTSSLFEGDAQIVDRGPLSSRPRYDIRFSGISLATAGRYEFQCKGIPWETLNFVLWVKGTWERAYVLEELGEVNVRFLLTKANGQTISEVNRPLKEWKLESRNGNLHGFWSFETRDITYTPDVSYNFTIIVENVKTKSPLRLEPCLYGGGIEQP